MALRVMVVDDNLLAAEATVGALKTAGHRGEALATAEAALRRHSPGEWDLVLTDVRLPGASGWELIERLHQVEPRLPVGVLTGWPPAAGEASASERGASFLLVKPVDPGDLLQAVALAVTDETTDG